MYVLLFSNTVLCYWLGPIYTGDLLTVSFYAYLIFTALQVDVIESQWNVLQAHVQNSHDFTELVGFHQEYVRSPFLKFIVILFLSLYKFIHIKSLYILHVG